MRIGTFGGRQVLVRGDHVQDVGDFDPDPYAVFERWTEFSDWAEKCGGPVSALDENRLGPPVLAPRQVFAVALNYPPHAAEAGYSVPSDPLVFTKFPSCLSGPRTTVELPEGAVDWEVELVAIIGTGGYQIPETQAWRHIAGLTVGQDISERKTQMRGTPPQFSLAKSFPGFGPTGPFLVTQDEFSNADDLAISCTLNGATVQEARTSDMIFGVAELVARLSETCPLLPGDLIFTGTPAGVGNRMNPPRYLCPGDELVSRVEGIGELRTRFSG